MDKIVCSALLHENGDMILGPRHFDLVMRKQILNYKLTTISWNNATQGFINQRGEFLDREQALRVAIEADQVKLPTISKFWLFSEDLY